MATSVVTYTAKREIIRRDLSIIAADISVSAADSSFNTAGVVDLSGLVSGDWVKVSGLVDPSATNNGWHQLTAASTATKIVTASVLTDEAAGADVAVVGYQHGLDQQYILDLTAKNISRKYKLHGKINTPIDGASEMLVDREEPSWDISLTPIHIDNIAPYREFLSSVMARETFTFDPYGSASSPDKPRSVELVSKSYSESSVGGNPKQVAIKFAVREL